MTEAEDYVDEDVEVTTARVKPKKRAPIFFGWCNTGHHDRCKVSNTTHTCECPCVNHGVNYAPSQATSPEDAMRILKKELDELD